MIRNHTLLTLFVPLVVIIFSSWLMFHTFSFSAENSQLLISAKAWSDFGSHLPLIRSFSRGSNWPPQYPLYPGEPIKYHYLFYSVVGWTEHLGVPINIGLNLYSSLGLAGLMILIFVFSAKLFKNIYVGILSLFFFVFNSSFSFLDFFLKHPFSSRTLSDIIHSSDFSSFGPWDGGPITAFWNLNIYTNQRHLGLSFAVLTLLIYFLHNSSKKIYLSGFLLGSLILLNQAAFMIGLVFCLWYFIRRPEIRTSLLFSGLGALPWILIAVNTLQIFPQISLRPGYLVSSPATLAGFVNFWIYNLGLNFFLIPVGFIFAPRSARILIFPAITLFVIGNIWKFSPDIINNHKLFNYFIIIGSMFTANLLIKICRLKIIGIVAFFILTFAVTIGGIIDIFPVINDRYLSVLDAPASRDVDYFLTLPPETVVLNSFWFYHPASLAGRSIYNGYSYFTWSYGYDQVSRERITADIYASLSVSLVCSKLKFAGIDYVELSPGHESFISPNLLLWQRNFIPNYMNLNSGLTVYSVAENCTNP